MANREHVNMLRQGVPAWNSWRAQHGNVRPDLRGASLPALDLRHADLQLAGLEQADLSGCDLSGADLTDASADKIDLTEAILRGATLKGADVYNARLPKADLTRADLYEARFSSADLRAACLRFARVQRTLFVQANLRGADLSFTEIQDCAFVDADLREANLYEAALSGEFFGQTDFARCHMGYTRLRAVDLSSAQGLAEVRHDAPSTIDIVSIDTARGHIPDVFLRGCATPAALLAFNGALAGETARHPARLIWAAYDDAAVRLAGQILAGLWANDLPTWAAFGGRDACWDKYGYPDKYVRDCEQFLLVVPEQYSDDTWLQDALHAILQQEQRTQTTRLLVVSPLDTQPAAAPPALADIIDSHPFLGFGRSDKTEWFEARLGALVGTLREGLQGE
jgi:uncharacterized protein YjbI with pentapeptide repeats